MLIKRFLSSRADRHSKRANIDLNCLKIFFFEYYFGVLQPLFRLAGLWPWPVDASGERVVSIARNRRRIKRRGS